MATTIVTMKTLQSIPTNIITGFLGAGKTTAILHLLKTKPAHERWAILVNEFGEVGIDGSILTNEFSQENGTFIKEVTGGCMCCVAGVPMQVALKNLLQQAKPDRLLIEPTGLGHPKEVLKILTSEHYREVLSLYSTITLVDARNITNERYVNHDIFNQQIDIADIIVGNKLDLYQGDEAKQLERYLTHKNTEKKEDTTLVHLTKNIHFIQHGEVELTWLNTPSKFASSSISKKQINKKRFESINKAKQKPVLLNPNYHPLKTLQLPECGYLNLNHDADEYYATGWRFKSEFIFNYVELVKLLKMVPAERIKALINTNKGIYNYNQVHSELNICKVAPVPSKNNHVNTETTIEIIFDKKHIEKKEDTLPKDFINKLLATLI